MIADMKILVLVSVVLAVAGAVDDCNFDAQEACKHCRWDRNWVQFVVNDCNCTIFYLCERTSDGVIIPHAQHCNPCFCFSNDLWTCSIRIKDDDSCQTTAPPPATDPAPTGRPYRNFFCVDFDKDYRDQRTYYNVDPACRLVNVSEQYSPGDIHQKGLKIEKQALLLEGAPCNVEIPYFQNNQFNQFTYCGMFIIYERPEIIQMGLIFNGFLDDCYPGSIKILLTAERKVKAEVATEGGVFEFTNSKTVSSYGPHKVCFRYDGSQNPKWLELVVDDYAEKEIFVNDFSGLTVREKCNLRLGEVVDKVPSSWGYYYYYRRVFYGILDTWCFSPSIVDESYFTAV